LADGTFADLRFDNTGQKRPEFILNKAPWKQANILVVGDNFGCGSSREHAVWGMRQLGINACIGTGFAGIFYDNARKNGLALPIVSSELRDTLLEYSKNKSGEEISIDLVSQTIKAGEILIPFEMDTSTQTSLIRGRDDTLDTLEYTNAIHNFETQLNDRMRVNVIK
jgi:3-isopropylmalate/(R)-2-methylmalate dehydratase small subunit